ncbi:MAG: Rne/Rng family ribonuclease [Solirubrobacterales bacterium]|nr:Rne/Rng family ribonuclease [Solirubrobacterales bacterium]
MRKQVLVTVDRGETRVAMLEAPGDPVAAESATGRSAKTLDRDFRVAEVYFERRGGRSIVGNIYKGKVDNVLPGLEAAFVDIGLDKNGFLHVDEIVLPGVEPVKRGRGQNGGGKQRSIAELLKPGQEIVCQVVKDPLKTKGARLSMELTIAGRYMVYAPTGEGVGVSRRLEDSERERLRKEVKGLDLHGGGAIVRTAAHGAGREAFERELLYLDKLNEVLSKRVAEAAAPALVFQEADLSIRVVRDIFSAHFERAVVDDEKQHQRLVSFFTRTAPELVDRVELWKPGAQPLFEAFGADEVIEGMLSRRVDLPSGGYLVIDYAEALTVIDVNSGSFIGRGKQARLEDTITKTNLEAADEVVNQLRLRDIGGIIVIDFIDMARARNRDAVLKVLRKALDEDRTKTFVVEISPLGLVEMTRQNVTDGVREIMTRPCPTCDGEGVIKSEETIAIEVERRLRELVKDAGEDGPQAYLIRINPRVTAQFIGNGAWMLRELESETGRYFHFEGSEGLPLDHFAVTLEGTREEVAEQAVPFREGEEVHVHIVEPHMYEVDDAVAKLDGYIISVTGAGRFVGQKRLVRIEEAGRTSATAGLIDVTDEERETMEAETSRSPGASASGSGRRGGRGRGTTTSRRRSNGAARAGKAEQAEAAVTDDDQGADPVDEPAASEKPPELLEGVAGEEADAAVQAPDDSSLPDEDGDAASDVLESKTRRRGRRGGRRRSRAKSDEADAAAASPDPTD